MCSGSSSWGKPCACLFVQLLALTCCAVADMLAQAAQPETIKRSAASCYRSMLKDSTDITSVSLLACAALHEGDRVTLLHLS